MMHNFFKTIVTFPCIMAHLDNSYGTWQMLNYTSPTQVLNAPPKRLIDINKLHDTHTCMHKLKLKFRCNENLLFG
ncbi:hypothetical protein Hanom_Chr17g01552341 [Helianthus anomalus]